MIQTVKTIKSCKVFLCRDLISFSKEKQASSLPFILLFEYMSSLYFSLNLNLYFRFTLNIFEINNNFKNAFKPIIHSNTQRCNRLLIKAGMYEQQQACKKHSQKDSSKALKRQSVS